MSRSNFKITRSDYSDRDTSDRIDWLDSFADNLATKTPQRSAVEVARSRGHQSIIDQINSIVGNRPRHATVEGIVQEMQERTGLKEYLRRMSSKDEQRKIAQQVVDTIFSEVNPKTKNAILNFITNRIETHRGLVAIPAIQEEILSTFRREGLQPQDVNNELVAKYISDCIVAERRKNPTEEQTDLNIGRGVGVQDMEDGDNSNSDFFKGLLADQG
jgi:hypothetical protein